MDFVSRAQWGARKPTSTSTDIHPVGVTIHWEGPPMGVFPHSQCASRVRSIQAYHMDIKKWADGAYNGIVCPHGSVFEMRGVGVRSAANGTDTANDSWYALCALVGVGDQITTPLLRGLDDGIAWLRKGGAGRSVNGHRDHKTTACPGDALYVWAHGPHPTNPEDDMTPAESAALTDALSTAKHLEVMVSSLGRLTEAIAGQTTALVAVGGVDEQALADALAPLLVGNIATISGPDLAAIATAVADETARRQES